MTYTLSPFAKAIVAFLGGLVAFLVGLVSDGDFTQQDVGTLVVWLLTTFGVYRVENRP